jgi:mannose/fructose/N-acetylgalactosamine-specific phosphotransferase system component IIB
LRDNAWGLDSIWARVDDRLIHGQVTVGWRQYLRYGEIWVVDDQVRGDLYVQDALCLAAPDGVVVRVYGVGEAVALLASGLKRKPTRGRTSNVKAERRPCRVLLLLRSPEAALALVERGVPLDRLNVGNLSARPGSVRVFRNISLTPAHVEALDALAERGVGITFQLTPEDAQADWTAVRRRWDS